MNVNNKMQKQPSQLGLARYEQLDALSRQHFKNMFLRLCRGENNTTTIPKPSLLTLVGSLGLIIPRDSRFFVGPPPTTSTGSPSSPQQQQRAALAAAAATTAVVDFEEATQCYDEAVGYCGKSMAECMEFFAMLDEDGDGVVDVGVLRKAICAPPGSAARGGISEAEFYYALDAARLLTGPADIGATNFDQATGSRLGRLRVDDDLRDEDAEQLPPTAPDAPLTGTIVPGGLTLFQFLNVILRFML